MAVFHRRDPLIPGSQGLANFLIVAVSICSFLAIICVGLRVWARRITKMRLDWSDYCCFLALLFSMLLVASSFACAISILRVGHSTLQIEIDKIHLFLKYNFAGQVLWALSNALVRLSILFLFITIFPVRRFEVATWILIGVNIAYCISVILYFFLICRPLESNWNWEPDYSYVGCGNQKVGNIAVGSLNITLDVSTVITPLPMLWRLQMNKKKKIALSGLFSLGILICIITSIRLHLLLHMDIQDPAKSYASVTVAAILEPVLGIVNACLPILRPVLNRFSKVDREFTTGEVTSTRRTGISGRGSFHRMESMNSRPENAHDTIPRQMDFEFEFENRNESTSSEGLVSDSRTKMGIWSDSEYFRPH